MLRSILPVLVSLMACSLLAAPQVLIVADEFPAMQLLADQLKRDDGIESRIVKQTEMPAPLSGLTAVVVYLHGKLASAAEQAMIDYARGGGKLIALHHSISSGKRTNEHWFSFLGVSLPQTEVNAGGYQWVEPVTLQLVNLAPDHFVTTNQIQWPESIEYRSEKGGAAQARPGLTLQESEVYLNHTLAGPRTLLLGFKYTDAKTGRTWMQDRAGWCKPVGKGWLCYLKAGHSVRDFEHPTYSRLVRNAILYQPTGAERR